MNFRIFFFLIIIALSSNSYAQWWVDGGNLIWPHGNVTIAKNLILDGTYRQIYSDVTGTSRTALTLSHNSDNTTGSRSTHLEAIWSNAVAGGTIGHEWPSWQALVGMNQEVTLNSEDTITSGYGYKQTLTVGASGD